MRRIAGLLVLPLAWYAMGCADAGSGDPAPDAGASERDLTTLDAEPNYEAVVSYLELGRTKTAVEAYAASGPSASNVRGAEVEMEVTVQAPALVSFADGLELASEPKVMPAPLPIMGAGAGTMLQPGVTVASIGEPMQLFQPVARGNSPWPEARTGEYPSVDRSGTGLIIGGYGGGGGGHCPRPGM